MRIELKAALEHTADHKRSFMENKNKPFTSSFFQGQKSQTQETVYPKPKNTGWATRVKEREKFSLIPPIKPLNHKDVRQPVGGRIGSFLP